MPVSNKEIKAVTFDFGGVILLNESGSVFRKLAELLGIPYEKFGEEYFKYNHLANVENMPWEDMAMKAVREFDTSEKTEEKARRIVQKYQTKHFLNKELLALFPALRTMGLKVAILSNSGRELREKLNAEGITPLVDEIVISGEIGYQKPHKEAFQILFDKLGLSAGEVVFIDDSPKSLEKASEIGYIPILFVNNKKLLEDLGGLGVAL